MDFDGVAAEGDACMVVGNGRRAAKEGERDWVSGT